MIDQLSKLPPPALAIVLFAGLFIAPGLLAEFLIWLLGV